MRVNQSQVVPALAGLLFTVCLGVRPVQAQTTLDFEGLIGMSNSPGSVIPVASRLSDAFLTTSGVTFSSGSPFVAVVNLGAGHATSGTNGIGGSTTAGTLTYFGSPLIVASFFDPTDTSFQAVTDFVSVRGDLHPAGGAITLSAFGVGGNLLGTSSANDSGGTTLSVLAPGIRSVQITGTGSVAFDDFTFNQVIRVTPQQTIPEPSTCTLVATGLLPLVGMVARRRRA